MSIKPLKIKQRLCENIMLVFEPLVVLVALQALFSIDISKCCRLPAINLGPAVEKCHKHIKSLKSHNPNYPVYAHVCYPECIYRETGSFIDGDIHMETVKNFLQNNVEQRDKIIVPTIVGSFQTCMSNIKNTMQTQGIKTYPKIEGLGCSPYASMIYGCVNAETFLHCPQEMWQNEESCNTAKNFALQCNPLPHVPLPTM
ncbi:odorant-binding protein 50e [Haematobia irritans]|uniref:odorant-binding protein 50e n=1 Tax=Haematobia irritans TaxID=7368 RepID=UPI003F50876C